MTTLYVTDHGVHLSLKHEQVTLVKDGFVLRAIPIEKLESVTILSRSHVEPSLSFALLERAIPVTYLSPSGKYIGRLDPVQGQNVDRQIAQFRAVDDPAFCLKLSRRTVAAKIRNGRTLLMRYQRDRPHEALAIAIPRLQTAERDAAEAIDLDMLRGLEGHASKEYFRALGTILPPPFNFTLRSRRPPMDRANACLSLGYTLLMYAFYTAVRDRGLHPYLGFYHAPRHGHPALCSDLIEDWRAPFIDAMLVSLVGHRELDPDQFTEAPEPGGIYLGGEGLKVFLNRFEQRMRTSNRYLTYVDHAVTYRESMAFQVGSLARAIELKDPDLYRPLEVR